MKRLLPKITTLLLTVVGGAHCDGGTIVIIDQTNNRVVGARDSGIDFGEEPIIASTTRGNATATLHLGKYSEADIGLTATFTRANTVPAEWDAFRSLLGVPFSPGLVRSDHLWLGLDTAKFGEGGNTTSLRVAAPTFNLQQVDITLTAYNRWFDSGNAYRVAEFNIKTYTLVPEPTCAVLLLVLGILSIAFRARTFPSWS